MSNWSITYDWSPDDGYDTHEEDLEEIFKGTWEELQDHIVQMRINGCYNIRAHEIYE